MAEFQFFLWLSGIPLCILVHLHIHLSIHGHLDCLSILNTVNVYDNRFKKFLYLCELVFLWSLDEFKSRITGLCDNSINFG